MDCPSCGAPTRVNGTRRDDGRVRRVRLCEGRGCWLRFSTTEQPDEPGDEPRTALPVALRRRRWAREWGSRQTSELPFASQHAGYFTTEDALAAGWSRARLTRRCQDDELVRLARGVYRDARVPESPHEALLVAWLWTGKQGAASHESALVLHEAIHRADAVHLTVPVAWAKRRLRLPASVELHATALREDETEIDLRLGVPLTTPLRTLLDLARAKRPHRVVRQAARRLEERRLVERGELVAAFTAAKLDPTVVLPRPTRG